MAAAAHPWFSAVGYSTLRVSRIVLLENGQHEKIVVQRAPGVVDFDPQELTDERAAMELLGPGRFEVSARGDQGRLYGRPYRLGLPDSRGHVPETEEEVRALTEGSAAPKGETFTVRDVLKIMERADNERVRVMQAALEQARSDRKQDQELMGTLLKAAFESRSDDKFLTFMMAQHTDFSKRLEKEAKAREELALKLVKKGSDDEFLDTILTKGLPLAQGFFARKEKPSAPASSSGEGERKIPSAREVREHIASGGVISPKDLARLAVLAKRGELDDGTVEAVREYLAGAFGLSVGAPAKAATPGGERGAELVGAGPRASDRSVVEPASGAGGVDPASSAGGGVPRGPEGATG